MKSSTYLRWVYSWWIAALAILAFGVYAKAQIAFGSPQNTIAVYKYLNITGQATTTVKSGGGILQTLNCIAIYSYRIISPCTIYLHSPARIYIIRTTTTAACAFNNTP